MAGTSEGGKKAAETRGHESLSKAGSSVPHEKRVKAGQEAAAKRGHESLSEAGRKGGQHSQGGRQGNRETEKEE